MRASRGESPWALRPDEEARTRAQAAIDEADTDSPAGRPRVERARAYSVHLVIERVLLERRSAAWQVRPGRPERVQRANEGDEGPLTVIDPWALDIKMPADWRGSRSEHRMTELALTRRCAPCAASGSAPCEFCARAGASPSCAHCGGAGNAPCSTCEGAGRVQATPMVIVEIGVESGVRVVESATLPQGLDLAISNLELSGTTLFTEQGAELAPRRSGGGPYRGSSLRVSEEVDAVIDAMLSEETAGSVLRVRERMLEVRKVVLYEAELDNGRMAYVCGSPARILPEGVLERRGGLLGKLRRMLGG